ncbi:MAG: family protein phosphatase, partial [Solirubrobacteraceae bacterium]|nr:family protein phosphatase [Solirubrobacteraceae bacterium]
MLRVSEQWYGSDVGRQRQGNEDNFFVRAPLFVVADGMGGAQAGEVASELAVEAFRDGLPDTNPEEALVGTIREANHRIHEMSQSDSQRQGMGTTCTAAYVGEREVVIAHVGDSRCYLLRDGELTRLTRDHSLVGELVDRGKLTEEQAEVHPQRSVITRALGPEADVRVDTERVEARGDDLFLLCSDGLTSMIREHALLPILQSEGGLEPLGRRLIAAANDAGGRDNITVVLFRLEEVTVAGSRHSDETTEQSAVADYEDFAPATRAREDTAPAPQASARQEAEYRAAGTVAVAAVKPSAPPPRTAPLPPSRDRDRGRETPPAKRGRLRRFTAPLVVVGILLVLLLVSAWIAIRGVFFVGLDANRTVTIYRGLPYELPAGIKLYTRDYGSGVTIDQVPANR